MTRACCTVMILMAALALPGCKKAPPPIVAVSGIVTLNGRPLDKAEVRFYPQVPDLASDFIGRAVTDDSGAFTILTNGAEGVAACELKVTVCEGPFPKECRGESWQAQQAMGVYLKTLKNRPLPEPYKTLPDTPLTITITGPQTDLKIEIKN